MADKFIQDMRQEVEEFLTTRQMHQAVILSQQTGQHFNHNQYPMFFTGDLQARMVLVHLNPKQPNTYTPTYEGPLRYPTYGDYVEYHAHFGQHNNGNPSPGQAISHFDSKQIQFLRPFNVIDFVQEQTRADRFRNLVKVIDHKLQLELIPYGSDTFSTNGFTPTILQPHIMRLLNIIAACPRDYVIFCGRVFADVFSTSIIRTHKFKLTKNDSTETKNYVRFSNLRLHYNGQEIVAGLAHSFAQQGIPMAAYGRVCHEWYSQ